MDVKSLAHSFWQMLISFPFSNGLMNSFKWEELCRVIYSTTSLKSFTFFWFVVVASLYILLKARVP